MTSTKRPANRSAQKGMMMAEVKTARRSLGCQGAGGEAKLAFWAYVKAVSAGVGGHKVRDDSEDGPCYLDAPPWDEIAYHGRRRRRPDEWKEEDSWEEDTPEPWDSGPWDSNWSRGTPSWPRHRPWT